MFILIKKVWNSILLNVVISVDERCLYLLTFKLSLSRIVIACMNGCGPNLPAKPSHSILIYFVPHLMDAREIKTLSISRKSCESNKNTIESMTTYVIDYDDVTKINLTHNTF